MDSMNRRDFLTRTTTAAVGLSLGARVLADPAAQTRPSAGKAPLKAADQVVLAKTGIKTSRLSIGTGTKGGSEQKQQGVEGMVKLFRSALDEGVRWWDVADMYKSHPYVKAALKEVKRDQVTITSKTWCREKTGNEARDKVVEDVKRFRDEMGTDYIDIVLLHCMEDPAWPTKLRPAMDALSEMKQKGWVRAVGCSCHSFEALKAAADEPWVEVDLARINPFATLMDVKKAEEVSRVEAVLKTMHERGKAVYGMKILGEGQFKGERIEESLRFALSKPYLSGFTIGFSKPEQITDIARRIDRLGIQA
jgi:aryl-alcohol dehydrogenase-like predicted oxidoreductase